MLLCRRFSGCARLNATENKTKFCMHKALIAETCEWVSQISSQQVFIARFVHTSRHAENPHKDPHVWWTKNKSWIAANSHLLESEVRPSSTCASRQKPQKQLLAHVYSWTGKVPRFATRVTPQTQNWLETARQQPCQFQFQFFFCFSSSRCHWPNVLFPFEMFLPPLRRLCWLRCVLMSKATFSWTVHFRSPVVRGVALVRASVPFLLSST